MRGCPRDLALFTWALDSKHCRCDHFGRRVRGMCAPGRVRERASMIPSMTGKLVRVEITETARLSFERWIRDPEMSGVELL